MPQSNNTVAEQAVASVTGVTPARSIKDLYSQKAKFREPGFGSHEVGLTVNAYIDAEWAQIGLDVDRCSSMLVYLDADQMRDLAAMLLRAADHLQGFRQ